MGLDLRLLVFYDEILDFSQDILSLNRRLKLFEKIIELEQRKGKKVSEKFRSFLGKNGYGKTIKTGTGSPLNYVLVEDLLECFDENAEYIKDWKNKAIWNYLKECPKNWKISLYWY